MLTFKQSCLNCRPRDERGLGEFVRRDSDGGDVTEPLVLKGNKSVRGQGPLSERHRSIDLLSLTPAKQPRKRPEVQLPWGGSGLKSSLINWLGLALLLRVVFLGRPSQNHPIHECGNGGENKHTVNTTYYPHAHSRMQHPIIQGSIMAA